MFSTFQTVSRIISGRGCIAALGEAVEKLNCTEVGIIADKGIIGANIHAPLVASLERHGISWHIYDQAQLDPTPGSIERAASWVKENGCKLLVGIGGGSSLDTTKATALLAAQPGPISRYFGMNKVPGACLPTILVPTTAGTGSEMTSNSVISDPATDTKQGIVSNYLYAKAVLLDPELTVSLPPFYTAITGIDALVHSMESFVSKNSTFLTDALNLQAMDMIVKNIRKAYARGSDIHAREKMLYGAAASGIAFSNTQNGIIHAIGMSVSHEHHIPHGLMMAICAPMGMAFNSIAVPEKYAQIAKIFGTAKPHASIEENASRAVDGLINLLKDLEIEPGLNAHGIRSGELRQIAEKAAGYKRLMDSNPRKGNADELERLLNRFY